MLKKLLRKSALLLLVYRMTTRELIMTDMEVNHKAEEASLEEERQVAADSPAVELLEEAEIPAADHPVCRLGTRILHFAPGA